jgi:hypothetical protein
MRRYCQGIAGIVLLAAIAACSDTGTQDGKVPFKGTNPEQFNALANQMKKVQAKNAQEASKAGETNPEEPSKAQEAKPAESKPKEAGPGESSKAQEAKPAESKAPGKSG